MKTTNISVIIPVFNEERSLPNVICELPKEKIDEIIVVNNASTDGSSKVAQDLGCRVVDELAENHSWSTAVIACQAATEWRGIILEPAPFDSRNCEIVVQDPTPATQGRVSAEEAVYSFT